jgi:hypothetical protein
MSHGLNIVFPRSKRDLLPILLKAKRSLKHKDQNILPIKARHVPLLGSKLLDGGIDISGNIV